ncbi:hypothetical protein [Streptomyces syringium]|uniref:hypothetical protein n=1 Tax=Streptomyces syringium TaxID=76729 RepID=UPI00341EC26D
MGGFVIRTASIGVLTGILAMGAMGAGTAAAAPSSPTAEKAYAFSGNVPKGFFKPTSRTIVKRNAGVPEAGKTARSPQSPDGFKDLRNVRENGELCGTSVIQKTSGAGKTTLVLSVDKSVAVQWSATASITASAVSAGVGFNVTKTYAVKNETRFEVPSGKHGTIEAYPLYDSYVGDVYEGGWLKTGTATVLKPIGVCFNQWT